MYWTVSEQLAEKHPTLRALLTRIDDVVAHLGGAAVLRPSVLAAETRESVARVTSTLGLFVSAGWMVRQQAARCSDENCGQLNEFDDQRAPGQCSQCGGQRFDKQPHDIYRLSASGLARVRAESGGFETLTWPDGLEAFRGKGFV